MIKALKNLLTISDGGSQIDEARDSLALITAALLIEVMVIDGNIDEKEVQSIKSLLIDQFDIAPDDISPLFENAQQQVKNATSLFEFTRAVNNEYSESQKFQLVKNLWKIAFADGNLDKFEEHIIRRITELIYLPHSQFIRAKQAARSEQR